MTNTTEARQNVIDAANHLTETRTRYDAAHAAYAADAAYAAARAKSERENMALIEKIKAQEQNT